ILATGSGDGNVRLWSVPAWQQLMSLPHAGRPVNSLSFSADSSLLATGGNDKLARVWGVASGDLRQSFPHPRAVQSVALSKDGSLLLTMDGQYARVFDVNGAKPPVLLSQKRPVTTAALSPDAKYVVTGGKDDLAVLWR